MKGALNHVFGAAGFEIRRLAALLLGSDCAAQKVPLHRVQSPPLESPARRVSPLCNQPKPATGQSKGTKVYFFASWPSSLTFSLRHREKQTQGPEETTIQPLLLSFQFFQLLFLQRWPEEAGEAQGQEEEEKEEKEEEAEEERQG